jgi:predicted unusual protein kinase regulating ubiquinone biosynthesis (AarF/ABC1/UbiB family)
MKLWGRGIRILWVSFRILIGYLVFSFVSRLLPQPTKVRGLDALHLKNATLFLETAVSLKGLMIKVGQFMSARVDLLPKAYTQKLSLLQDEVPPAPIEEIREKIKAELGAPPETLFASFDEIPLASASFGQVHRAVLKVPLSDSTTDVAIKIQYPHIEAIVATDLKAIRLIVLVLQRIFTHIRFDILTREFERIVRLELNYIAEAKNAEKFHKLFLEDDRFVVPKVVWQFTTERVLTLTMVTGIKINHFDALEKAGVCLKEVAQLLVESYMKQIFLYRFFHADPHPGNLFVQPAGKKGLRLVFVDFGMMQEIDDKTDQGLRKTILAIINRDTPLISRGLMDLGFISRKHRGGRLSEIEQVVQFFMDRYRDISPRAFKTITIDDIAKDLGETFSIYSSLQVPNLFILAGRAVGMLNGLCSQLDPDANIIDLAQPYAKKFARSRSGIKEVLRQGKELLSALLSLPAALSSFLELSHGSGVQTHMTSEGVEMTLTKIYNLAYRFLIVLTIVLVFIYIQWTSHFGK